MKKAYAAILISILFILFGVTHFSGAFTGPSSSGGVGAGAIAVDGFNNIAIGTSTTNSITRLYLQASSTATTAYSFRVLQPSGSPLLTIRDDGAVAIATTTPSGATSNKLSVGGDVAVTGTLTATTLIGTLSGTLSATNVSANVFGSGNFAFPASLGIATTSQAGLPAALSVYGNGYITGTLTVGATTSATVATFGGGSGKIDVGTVDPPYTINGKPYATYLPSMTGVKEETTGVGMCAVSGSSCTVRIDFANAPEGSDAWLFSKITDLRNNFDHMTVLATPSFDGSVWYEKDAKHMTVTLHATMPRGVEAGEISYRFTAPRFDASLWPNVPRTVSSPGFIINE